MTPDSNKRSADGKGLRRTGVAGIAFGALALFACELPIVLAVIGFGGLGAVAAAFRPPPIVETAGMVSGGIGVLLLFGFVMRRLWTRGKGART